uniref:Reticulocyte binding protein n=1 Tax=Strongyloides venezuelensis TaxID=75913 RepID=A0A0K0G477_STRVS
MGLIHEIENEICHLNDDAKEVIDELIRRISLMQAKSFKLNELSNVRYGIDPINFNDLTKFQLIKLDKTIKSMEHYIKIMKTLINKGEKVYDMLLTLIAHCNTVGQYWDKKSSTIFSLEQYQLDCISRNFYCTILKFSKDITNDLTRESKKNEEKKKKITDLENKLAYRDNIFKVKMENYTKKKQYASLNQGENPIIPNAVLDNPAYKNIDGTDATNLQEFNSLYNHDSIIENPYIEDCRIVMENTKNCVKTKMDSLEKTMGPLFSKIRHTFYNSIFEENQKVEEITPNILSLKMKTKHDDKAIEEEEKSILKLKDELNVLLDKKDKLKKYLDNLGNKEERIMQREYGMNMNELTIDTCYNEEMTHLEGYLTILEEINQKNGNK